MGALVRGLAITPIKGTRLLSVDRVELGPFGARENRRFYLIDERDRMVNGKQLGALQSIVARYDDGARRLRIELPDGRTLEDEVRTGAPIQTRFFSTAMDGQLVDGPWSSAISEHVGRSLRLVEAGPVGAVDRGALGPVSLISSASLARLAQAAGRAGVDPRRFRMLLEIEGIAAHEEDRWVGRAVRIGGARIRFAGHVGRCLVTSRDPEDGTVDLPTLEIIGAYRRGLGTTEPLPFGIYGEVLDPGTVRLGDTVVPEG